MHTILLVEDDQRLASLIKEYLEKNTFNVVWLRDGNDLVQHVANLDPALIILDVMLPNKDGFELCKEVRMRSKNPILFMTAKGDDFDQILGLELGADDYVIKPVEPRVLLARMNALLRRTHTSQMTKESESSMVFGQLTIDKSSRQVTLFNEEIVLTSHEFDLLCLLAANASQLVTRDTIYDALIGRAYDGLDRSADVRISHLRKKLRDNHKNPYRIKTIWGKGFFFVSDAWE